MLSEKDFVVTVVAAEIRDQFVKDRDLGDDFDYIEAAWRAIDAFKKANHAVVTLRGLTVNEAFEVSAQLAHAAETARRAENKCR